jgi:CheY-like chemotaxis protein
LRTDAGKLKQVLINLVGNALKFTEEGEVVVRVESTASDGAPERILVRDTGVGIPPDRLETVFEAFQQADGSTTRRFGGTGLGLTISRSLCALMGYSVSVESEVGKGSAFTIHLAPGAEQDRVGGLEGLEGASRARWAPSALDPATDLAGKTVLVVDDEADSRTLLRHYLEELGCRVMTAQDGVEGLEIARSSKPDLITIDLMMPRMSGWEMFRALKDDPMLRDVPAVIVSVVAEEGTGQFLGAVDLLSKPVDRDELIRLLRRNVSREAGRVLVVEDNPDARLILQRYLREAGLVVHTVENGEAALSFLSRGEVDLVLLDLLMPVMDGFTMLRRLRKAAHGRNVPVVVLTAKELTEEEGRILEKQASGVIMKGGEVQEQLREVLDQYFRPTVGPGEE